MKRMQVFNIQDCKDNDLRSWAINFLLDTATYQHGNDSYLKVHVYNDPDAEDCFFHEKRHYKTTPADAANLLKLKDWMESEGLDYSDSDVLIKIWW